MTETQTISKAIIMEIADTVTSANHKAIVLVGVLQSPKGRHKANIVAGLANSIDRSMGELVAHMFALTNGDYDEESAT
jgi:hypothetical protein